MEALREKKMLDWKFQTTLKAKISLKWLFLCQTQCFTHLTWEREAQTWTLLQVNGEAEKQLRLQQVDDDVGCKWFPAWLWLDEHDCLIFPAFNHTHKDTATESCQISLWWNDFRWCLHERWFSVFRIILQVRSEETCGTALDLGLISVPFAGDNILPIRGTNYSRRVIWD